MGTTKKRMRVVSIKLPPELDDRVTEIAERDQVSRSLVVREALAAYTRSPVTSVTDAVGARVGVVRGPRDLSTHPKHLRGYGE